MQKVKNQHYVPRCYLRNFADRNDKDRIFIFDKVKLEVRKQRIENVASERYFYDIPFRDLIERVGSEKVKKDLGLESLEEVLNTEQEMERHFAQKVEGRFQKLLQHIISIYNLVQEKSYNTALILNQKQKSELSILITIQIFRTKEFREFIIQMYERGMKAIVDKAIRLENDEYSPENVKLKLRDEVIPLKHAEHLMDNEEIIEFANILNNHIWIIGVNRTSQPFYTSDFPVVKYSHLGGSAGYASQGVEIAFPITSNLILIMYERTHVKLMEIFENRFIIMDRDEVVFYNSKQVFQSYRQVYCLEDKFELAERICNEHPDIRDEKRERFFVG